MAKTVDPNAVLKCVRWLEERFQYNVEHKICSSENRLIGRLLTRTNELKKVYSEFYSKLNASQLGSLLDCLLCASVYWNPDANKKARDSKQRLIELNQDIAKKAFELSILLKKRSEISNSSGFYSNNHYHICDVMEQAAISNHLFTCHVKEPVAIIREQFELKYWPDLEDIIGEIGKDAENATVTPSNTLTDAATSNKRESLTDYFKVMFSSFDDRSTRLGGHLPERFTLTDATLATIANVFLDLTPDDLVDAVYVKGLRQRLRKSSATNLLNG